MCCGRGFVVVIAVLFACSRVEAQGAENGSDVVVLSKVLDARSNEPYHPGKVLELPEAAELAERIKVDIKENKAREAIRILREWPPASLPWQVVAEVSLFRMENWHSYPATREELGVMVDLFRATVKEGDRPYNYDVPRGGFGSPFVFRSRFASKLAQAAEPRPGYMPDAKAISDNPLKWLEEEIISRTGSLPSILSENQLSARESEVEERPSKRIGGGSSKSENEAEMVPPSSRKKLWILVGTCVTVLLLSAIAFGKRVAKSGVAR